MTDLPRPAPGPAEGDSITVEELVRQVLRLLAFVRRHLWRALLLGAAGGAAAVAVAAAFPTVPSAYTELRLVTAITENPIESFERRNLAFFRTPEQSFRAIPLIRRTVEGLGTAPATDALLADIQDRLRFHAVADKTYRATFRGGSGEAAVHFLGAHLANYLADEIAKTLGVLEQEAIFLESSLERLAAELRASEEAVREFKEENADGLPDQAREHYLLLRTLERQAVEVKAGLEQVSLELRLNREKLAGEKLFVESKVISTQRDQPYLDALTGVRTRLAEAEAAGLTEEHPERRRLMRLHDLLEALHSQSSTSGLGTAIERERNPIYESIQDTVYQLEVREQVMLNQEGQIAAQLERARTIVARLPTLEAQYAELTRSYESASALYQRLLRQQRVTRLQYDLEKASALARSDVITPPRLEYVARARRLAIHGGAGLFLGLSLALAWAVAVEVRLLLARGRAGESPT